MDRRLFVVCVVGCFLLAGCVGGGPGDGPTSTTDGRLTDADADGDAPPAGGEMEVHFISVGQSASTLIVSPEGETTLVDTGDFTDDGEYVLQYLRRHDVQRIDHLVVSHNDADHIGGNAAVIEYYETEADGVGAVYDPGIAASTNTYQEYLDAVETHDVTLYRTLEGDTVSMTGVSVRVLGPPQPYLENEARNENSIVLKVVHGESSFLFTGDAEDDQEAYLVEEYGSALEADVMKAGHHGSKTSTGGPILDAADPDRVVVSSAYDSRYGHPDEATLRRLAERSIPTYWTATHGDIVFVSDGESVTVSTQRSAPTDPLSIRDGDPVDPGSTDPVEPRERLSGGGEPLPTQETETPETTVTDGAVSLELSTVNADAEGDDRENLVDEYVVLTNTGPDTVDMGGWRLADAAGATYTFPDGFSLDPGASVTVHTGSGTDSATDLYWGSGRPVWNNDGDTVIVTAADGTVVLEEDY